MRYVRKILAIAVVLVMAMQLVPLAARAADPMEDILGVYEGYYYASQGQTGVTLTVYEEEGAVKAIFEFYNLPNRTNAKSGSFYMDVLYKDGEYHFDATTWIEKPSTYNTVDIYVTLSGNVLSGNVNSSSWVFYAEKANAAYSDVQNSIYNDHRYEVVDEGMTWSAAKAYAEERGGYLATITSAGEQAFIERLLQGGKRNQYWLGARRNGISFKWVTGESFDYTNWNTGEPNNYRDVEDCLQIERVSNPAISGSRAMAWNDVPEDNTIPGEEEHFSLSTTGLIIEYDVWSDASDWATGELQDAYENGLIPDILIGRELNGVITRGEFAAVTVKLYEAISGNRMIIAMDAPFQDIDNTAERLYILKAYNYDIVAGISDTEYAPDDLLTREQMATMLTRVYQKYLNPDYTIATDEQYPLDHSGVSKFADDGDISGYAYASVYFMVKNGIISGVGNNMFAPKNTTTAQAAANYANATREQALLISSRTLRTLG